MSKLKKGSVSMSSAVGHKKPRAFQRNRCAPDCPDCMHKKEVAGEAFWDLLNKYGSKNDRK